MRYNAAMMPVKAAAESICVAWAGPGLDPGETRGHKKTGTARVPVMLRNR